jgi:hypothetical protein
LHLEGGSLVSGVRAERVGRTGQALGRRATGRVLNRWKRLAAFLPSFAFSSLAGGLVSASTTSDMVDASFPAADVAAPPPPPANAPVDPLDSGVASPPPANGPTDPLDGGVSPPPPTSGDGVTCADGAAADPVHCCVPDPAVPLLNGVNLLTGQQWHQASAGFGVLDVRVGTRDPIGQMHAVVRVDSGYINMISPSAYCWGNGVGGYVFQGPDAWGRYWIVKPDGSRATVYMAFDANGYPYVRSMPGGWTKYYNRPGDTFATQAGPAWRLASIEEGYPDGTPNPNVATVAWNTAYAPAWDGHAFVSYTTPVDGEVAAAFGPDSVTLSVSGVPEPYTEVLTQVVGSAAANGIQRYVDRPYPVFSWQDVLIGQEAHTFDDDTLSDMVLSPSQETPTAFAGLVYANSVAPSPSPTTLQTIETDLEPATLVAAPGEVSVSAGGQTSSVQVDPMTGLVMYEDDGGGNTYSVTRNMLGAPLAESITEDGVPVASVEHGYDPATGMKNYEETEELGGVTDRVVTASIDPLNLTPIRIDTVVNGVQIETDVPIHTYGPYPSLAADVVTVYTDVWGAYAPSTNTVTYAYPDHVTVVASDEKGHVETDVMDSNARLVSSWSSSPFGSASMGISYGAGGYVSGVSSTSRFGSGVPVASSETASISGATFRQSYNDLNGLVSGSSSVTLGAGGVVSSTATSSVAMATGSETLQCSGPRNCSSSDAYSAPGGIAGGGTTTYARDGAKHHDIVTGSGSDNGVPRYEASETSE